MVRSGMADFDYVMSIVDFICNSFKTDEVKHTTSPSFVSTQVTEARRFYLDLNPARHRPVVVVCGGCERCHPDYEVRRKSFPYLAVEFVAEGEGTLILDGRQYRLRPGMVFSYGDKVSHVIRNESQRPMLKYYVDFVGVEARHLLDESPVKLGRATQVSAPNEVQGIFENLLRDGSRESRYHHRLCAALIPLLLFKIGEKAISAESSHDRALAAYQRVRQYLEQNYLRLKTVDEIARDCRVDAAYICRLFQRFDHITPYQYLMRLKMNHATELLLDSGLLVKEVAERLNFSDPYNFSRAFKNIFGLSPALFVQRSKRT